MSIIYSLLVVVATILVASSPALCKHDSNHHDSHQESGMAPLDYYLLHDSCEAAINEQTALELFASITYLNMAGYFDRPTVARAGFAKFFREQSQEEYGHATKLIEYINKRNGTVQAISVDPSAKAEWSSPSEALADAINLERHVYSKLRDIHMLAEQKCLDAHLTDFLEGHFFTEQVDSIRELQTMLSQLRPADPSASVLEQLEDYRLKGDL